LPEISEQLHHAEYLKSVPRVDTKKLAERVGFYFVHAMVEQSVFTSLHGLGFPALLLRIETQLSASIRIEKRGKGGKR
jgi:hypothetical protein